MSSEIACVIGIVLASILVVWAVAYGTERAIDFLNAVDEIDDREIPR